MTETKKKKKTTAQRVLVVEDELQSQAENLSQIMQELGQLQQALINIVRDFDERMVGMSGAISTMAGIITAPQQQQPRRPAPPPKKAEEMPEPLNVITTDEEPLPAGEET